MSKARVAEIRQYLIENGAEMTRDRFQQDELVGFMRSIGYEFCVVSHIFGNTTLYAWHLMPHHGEPMKGDWDVASFDDVDISFYHNIVVSLSNMWEDLQSRGLESSGIQLPLF